MIDYVDIQLAWQGCTPHCAVYVIPQGKGVLSWNDPKSPLVISLPKGYYQAYICNPQDLTEEELVDYETQYNKPYKACIYTKRLCTSGATKCW